MGASGPPHCHFEAPLSCAQDKLRDEESKAPGHQPRQGPAAMERIRRPVMPNHALRLKRQIGAGIDPVPVEHLVHLPQVIAR